MCRGGDRNYPGGKRSGPKPKMDEESVAKRMKRESRQAHTAQRKAADAAAAEQQEEAEQQRALLREQLADLPMCSRRMLIANAERMRQEDPGHRRPLQTMQA